MRIKLLKLLKKLESNGGFINEYSEYLEDYEGNYFIKEYISFPNYRLIAKKYNEENPVLLENGLVSVISTSSIMAELKRMESDDFIMIGIQDCKVYGVRMGDSQGPPDVEAQTKTESIILTTKGKSSWRYFLHKATENPVTLSISLISIVISILALLI